MIAFLERADGCWEQLTFSSTCTGTYFLIVESGNIHTLKKTSHTSLLSLFKGILKPAPCFLFLLLLPVSHYLLTCQFSHKVQPSFGFNHSLYGVPHGPCTSLVHMLTDHCSFLPRTCLIAVTVPQSVCTAGPLLHSLKTSPAVIISSGSNNSVAQKAG